MTLNSVLSCLSTLKKLGSAKTTKERKAILCKCDKKVFYSICEICKNVLEKNIPITERRVKNLSRYKKYIRLLARKSAVPLKTKRKIILQKGGFLPNLLIPTTTILAKLLVDNIK